MVTKLKGFEEIDPTKLPLSPFDSIGKDWMEIVAGAPNQKVGAMTAAWGGFGWIWQKPVAMALVRGAQDRATRPILDAQPLFTLCFLGDEYQEAKMKLGRTHGWDYEDKIAAAGLSCGWCGLEIEHDPSFGIGEHMHTPFIEESQVVLVCEKICSQELPQESFVSPSVWEAQYAKKGESQHRLYIAEIRAAFARP